MKLCCPECESENYKFLGGHTIGKVSYLCKDCGLLFDKDYNSLPYPYPGMIKEEQQHA